MDSYFAMSLLVDPRDHRGVCNHIQIAISVQTEIWIKFTGFYFCFIYLFICLFFLIEEIG